MSRNVKNIGQKLLIRTAMKSKLFICMFSLLPLLWQGCSDEDGNPPKKPIMEGAGIVEEGQTLNPGDMVHVYGNGFRESDRISFDVRWDTGDELMPEGLRSPVDAEIMSWKPDEITVRMPYRMPEARVEVFLSRNGERMSVGNVLLTDGMTPKDFRLYGIDNGKGTIETIYADHETELKTWDMGARTDFRSPTNVTQTYGLCGLAEEDGLSQPFFFDFCTGEWKHLKDYYGFNALALADTGGNGTAAFLTPDGSSCLIAGISSGLERSDYATPQTRNSPPVSPFFTLPEGLSPEMFGSFPGTFMQGNGTALLSADKGNGRWSLVAYALGSGFYLLEEEVEAEAVVPFYFHVEPTVAEPSSQAYKLAGYAISHGDGESLFRLIDNEKPELQEAFASLPGKVVYVTHCPGRHGTITVLVENDGKRSVMEYDRNSDTWSGYDGLSNVAYDAIVWGN